MLTLLDYILEFYGAFRHSESHELKAIAEASRTVHEKDQKTIQKQENRRNDGVSMEVQRATQCFQLIVSKIFRYLMC